MSDTSRSIGFTPIGAFFSATHKKWQAPRQSGLGKLSGIVRLDKDVVPREALEDLSGFERIWLIYQFHEAKHAKGKVMPPRGNQKRGVLATRSPHRVNHIGMSTVICEAIEGFNIFVSQHDLIDGTPILDIKPYIPYCDSFPDAAAGWVDTQDNREYEIVFSDAAQGVLNSLGEQGHELRENITSLLRYRPFEYPNHRVRVLNDSYEVAAQAWRARFTRDDDADVVTVRDIYQG